MENLSKCSLIATIQTLAGYANVSFLYQDYFYPRVTKKTLIYILNYMIENEYKLNLFEVNDIKNLNDFKFNYFFNGEYYLSNYDQSYDDYFYHHSFKELKMFILAWEGFYKYFDNKK